MDDFMNFCCYIIIVKLYYITNILCLLHNSYIIRFIVLYRVYVLQYRLPYTIPYRTPYSAQCVVHVVYCTVVSTPYRLSLYYKTYSIHLK